MDGLHGMGLYRMNGAGWMEWDVIDGLRREGWMECDGWEWMNEWKGWFICTGNDWMGWGEWVVLDRWDCWYLWVGMDKWIGWMDGLVGYTGWMDGLDDEWIS